MSIKVDWSVQQFCLDCKREMRKSHSPADGRISYGSRGYCKSCSTRVANVPLVRAQDDRLDWTVEQLCVVCQSPMEKRHTPGSEKVAYGQGGKCTNCRTREKRHATGVVPKLPQEFDGHGVVCYYCKEHKPFTEYNRSAKSRSGYDHYCKRCNRLRHHKVDSSVYTKAVTDGTYLCQICGKDEETNGKALAIDHDHNCCPGSTSCGKCFRGFLCNNCNGGLGLFNDSKEHLKNAIRYIEQWEDGILDISP